MKTTLVLDDQVLRRAKEEAARSGQTLSQLVEGAIRLHLKQLRSGGRARELPSLPQFDGGGALVDVADRNALHDAMERP
jgi:hypothetical protein